MSVPSNVMSAGVGSSLNLRDLFQLLTAGGSAAVSANANNGAQDRFNNVTAGLSNDPGVRDLLKFLAPLQQQQLAGASSALTQRQQAGIPDFNTVRDSTLSDLRAQAQPFEQRAGNQLQQDLFDSGRMGTTGGGIQTEAFARGLAQADQGRVLASNQEARNQQTQADTLLGSAFRNFDSLTAGSNQTSGTQTAGLGLALNAAGQQAGLPTGSDTLANLLSGLSGSGSGGLLGGLLDKVLGKASGSLTNTATDAAGSWLKNLFNGGSGAGAAAGQPAGTIGDMSSWGGSAGDGTIGSLGGSAAGAGAAWLGSALGGAGSAAVPAGTIGLESLAGESLLGAGSAAAGGGAAAGAAGAAGAGAAEGGAAAAGGSAIPSALSSFASAALPIAATGYALYGVARSLSSPGMNNTEGTMNPDGSFTVTNLPGGRGGMPLVQAGVSPQDATNYYQQALKVYAQTGDKAAAKAALPAPGDSKQQAMYRYFDTLSSGADSIFNSIDKALGR